MLRRNAWRVAAAAPSSKAKTSPTSGGGGATTRGKNSFLFKKVDAAASQPLVASADVDSAFAELVGDNKRLARKTPADEGSLRTTTVAANSSQRARDSSRLATLQVPPTVDAMRDTTFGELQDASEEWRQLVGLGSNDARTEHRVAIAGIGDVTLRLSANATALHAVYASQLRAAVVGSSPTALDRRIVCDAEVTALAGDVREPESVRVKAKASLITPTFAGTTDDAAALGATSRLDAITNVSLVDAALPRQTGHAYQSVSMTSATLRFQSRNTMEGNIHRTTARSFGLGGPHLVGDSLAEGTLSRKRLDEQKAQYTHSKQQKVAVTPLTVLDNAGHHVAVVAPEAATLASRDAVRSALHTAFFRAIVPATQAALLGGVTVANRRTGDAAFIIGRPGSGRLTCALHAVARSPDLVLVSHGITCATLGYEVDGSRGRREPSSRVEAILARCALKSSSFETSVRFQKDDVVLFGPPTHPLVRVGALFGTDASLPFAKAARKWLSSARPPHIDACDVDLLRGFDVNSYARGDVLWNAAHSIRFDVPRCFNRGGEDATWAGRLAKIIVLDWSHPEPSASRHIISTSSRRGVTWKDTFSTEACAISTLNAPDDDIEEVFTNRSALKLHRMLRGLQEIAVDNTTPQHGAAPLSETERIAQALVDNAPSAVAERYRAWAYARLRHVAERPGVCSIVAGPVNFDQVGCFIVDALSNSGGGQQ